jgi:hypothetical protein
MMTPLPGYGCEFFDEMLPNDAAVDISGINNINSSSSIYSGSAVTDIYGYRTTLSAATRHTESIITEMGVNCTDCGRRVLLRDWYDYVFYAYYYGLLSVLTIVNVAGNTAVISSILRHRQLRLPANYFLFSIACSDLILGIIYPIYNVSHIDRPEIKRVLGMY